MIGNIILNEKQLKNYEKQICRKFADKVEEKFKNAYTITAVEIGIAINEVLAEMEQGNENERV